MARGYPHPQAGSRQWALGRASSGPYHADAGTLGGIDLKDFDVAACWSRASRSSAVSRRIVSAGVSEGALGAEGSKSIGMLAGAERARLPPFRVVEVSHGNPLSIIRIAADP
jgi:hypothetical protein